MKLMFLGPPGAGKGTQAAAVSKILGIPHISTGDMLREEIRSGTEFGLLAKSYIDAGNLVPDAVIIGMVKRRIARQDAANGFILDGFPRTCVQAQSLNSFAKLDVVINIEASDETLIKRISDRRVCGGCGASHQASQLKGAEVCPLCDGLLTVRDDDNEETIVQRIRVYKQKTKPLVDYYTERGILVNVPDSDGIEGKTREIMRLLEKRK